MTPAVPSKPTPSRGRALRRVANGLHRSAALVVIVVVWQIAATLGDSVFFPPPSEIVTRMGELWLSGPPPLFLSDAVATDIAPSLIRMLAGLTAGAVLGVCLGVLLGMSGLASALLMPSFHFLRSIPATALLPVFLILLSTGWTMRVVFIAFGVMWPVLLNTMEGVRSIDPARVETAKAFGLSGRVRLFRVILPSAMPKILAGLSTAIPLGLILTVVSEFVAASDGIGFQTLDAQRHFRLTDMWAGILLIAITGLLLTLAFRFVESRVLRWHTGATRRAD
jgi:ABC-type nitrate/sulfonate/bicarbonate transport system permease component